AFERAHWRFGLERASTWMERPGELVQTRSAWTDKGLYAAYEGIPNGFWETSTYTNDHLVRVGLYGWLPQATNTSLDLPKATVEKVWMGWKAISGTSPCWLCPSAARNGEMEKACEWLLHLLFEFSDVWMSMGAVRVTTPYFQGSGALLYVIAMMAKGWSGSNRIAPGFPNRGWEMKVEG
ncbi:hypothetical protein BD311DRAFT_623237, partial [Dichomitus squalens]